MGRTDCTEPRCLYKGELFTRCTASDSVDVTATEDGETNVWEESRLWIRGKKPNLRAGNWILQSQCANYSQSI